MNKRGQQHKLKIIFSMLGVIFFSLALLSLLNESFLSASLMGLLGILAITLSMIQK